MTNKEFIKNVLKYSIPTIVSAIIALTVIPIVSRLFPEEEYGYITNYYSFGMLFMGLFLLGFDSAYIRFYNEKYENTNVNGMLLVSAIVGLLARPPQRAHGEVKIYTSPGFDISKKTRKLLKLNYYAFFQLRSVLSA